MLPEMEEALKAWKTETSEGFIGLGLLCEREVRSSYLSEVARGVPLHKALIDERDNYSGWVGRESEVRRVTDTTRQLTATTTIEQSVDY
ncbi:hypothetical protein J6590_030032 [Homalodisca vitripennis]|nr:hypothetical protein J6590_030032 [Homalodisca vitripennis]